MAKTALAAAALCVLAPISIPIGPVPITLSVLVVCIFCYAVGWRIGLIGVAVYLLVGALGLPVFAGYEGGLQKLIGPTGGYLVGYLPMVLAGGIVIEKTDKRYLHFAALLAGLASLYALGTVWLSIYLKTDVASALAKAVLPFIPIDLLKLAAAVAFGPMLKKRLENATKTG